MMTTLISYRLLFWQDKGKNLHTLICFTWGIGTINSPTSRSPIDLDKQSPPGQQRNGPICAHDDIHWEHITKNGIIKMTKKTLHIEIICHEIQRENTCKHTSAPPAILSRPTSPPLFITRSRLHISKQCFQNLIWSYHTERKT